MIIWVDNTQIGQIMLCMNSINTNSSAMAALQVLNANNKALDETQNRISTGLKVSSAKDNGAVYQIAQKQRAEVASWKAVNDGLNRIKGILDITQFAVSDISDILTQMKSKALSLKDESLDTISRAAIQTDITALRDQITNTANNASFDGVNLLDGSAPSIISMDTSYFFTPYATLSEPTTGDPSIVLGQISDKGTVNLNFTLTNAISGYQIALENYNPNGYDELVINSNRNATGNNETKLRKENTAGGVFSNFFAININYLGGNSGPIEVNNASFTPDSAVSHTSFLSNTQGDNNSLDEFSMTSSKLNIGNLDYTNPDAVFSKIDTAFNFVNQKASYYGTQSNSIDNQINQNTKLIDVLTTGIGNMVDADMAKEAATAQSLQVKQQLAVQSLSISNKNVDWILSLFK